MPGRATISLFSDSSGLERYQLMTFFHMQCKQPDIYVDQILLLLKLMVVLLWIFEKPWFEGFIRTS